jgi:hypothetical protein
MKKDHLVDILPIRLILSDPNISSLETFPMIVPFTKVSANNSMSWRISSKRSSTLLKDLSFEIQGSLNRIYFQSKND